MDRNGFSVLALFLTVVLGQAIGLCQNTPPTIYGIGANNCRGFQCDGTYTFSKVSAVSGAPTPIGSTVLSVNPIAFAPNGVLYGAGDERYCYYAVIGGFPWMWCYNAHNLLIVDKNTGIATELFEIRGVNIDVGTKDLAFRSDGDLFAVFTDHSLYTIPTKAPAQATLVGRLGTLWEPTGLAFTADDVLYVSDSHYLYRVDASAAAVTQIAPLSVPVSPPRVGPMKFDPVSGALYAFVSSDTVSRTPYLGTIDISTGAVRLVGPSILGVGLAIPPAEAPIPALSRIGFVVLTTLLGCSAVLLVLRANMHIHGSRSSPKLR